MKIYFDPMPELRLSKKQSVNEGFATKGNAFIDVVYAQKRLWAETQDTRLQAEANLRGISIAALSAAILSKPDLMAEREFTRQKIMKAIDAAQTPPELENLKW